MSTCDCGFRWREWREWRQIPKLPNGLLADFGVGRKAKSRCRPNRNPNVTLITTAAQPDAPPRRRSGSGGREVAYKGFLDRAAIHPGSFTLAMAHQEKTCFHMPSFEAERRITGGSQFADFVYFYIFSN